MSFLILKAPETSLTKNQILPFILAGISLIVMLYLRITQREKIAGHLLNLTLYIIIIYMMHFRHENTFVYAWIFIFAVISFVLTNKWAGLTYNFLLILSIISEFYLINNTGLYFQEEYKIRFILVFASIVFISYLHEYLREKNIAINRSINKERVKYIAALIKEKQNNQIQLQEFRNELDEMAYYKFIIKDYQTAAVIANADEQMLWFNKAFLYKLFAEHIKTNSNASNLSLNDIQNKIFREQSWYKKEIPSTSGEKLYLYTLKKEEPNSTSTFDNY